MSSHRSLCVICGTETWCHDDTHVLGFGGCGDEDAMDFCSVACFMTLRQRWDARVRVVRSHPEGWPQVAAALKEALAGVLPATDAPVKVRGDG